MWELCQSNFIARVIVNETEVVNMLGTVSLQLKPLSDWSVAFPRWVVFFVTSASTCETDTVVVFSCVLVVIELGLCVNNLSWPNINELIN